ncbi:MAG: helix-turn-helix domain-containing protein [Candidatus Altimarinota bacterium]
MEKSQKNILAENIKKLRKQHDLTQEELARKADIAYTSLTKIEIGVIKEPSVYVVAKIAKAFDVTIESLLINDEK